MLLSIQIYLDIAIFQNLSRFNIIQHLNTLTLSSQWCVNAILILTVHRTLFETHTCLIFNFFFFGSKSTKVGFLPFKPRNSSMRPQLMYKVNNN